MYLEIRIWSSAALGRWNGLDDMLDSTVTTSGTSGGLWRAIPALKRGLSSVTTRSRSVSSIVSRWKDWEASSGDIVEDV